jgi:hypothetical protein
VRTLGLLVFGLATATAAIVLVVVLIKGMA